MNNKTSDSNILRIALATPLRRYFDYLPPLDIDLKNLKNGLRVLVPFGYRQAIGILVAQNTKSEIPITKLKRVIKILDQEPLLPESIFKLCHFAAHYYHHALGDVYISALPKLLRKGGPLPEVSISKITELKTETLTEKIHKPNHLQQKAITTILDGLNQNKIFLLDGITGSGKTEVYLRVIENLIALGKQALILVPEISLTPQTLSRFKARFQNHEIVVFHSRLTDKERLIAWQKARVGSAAIIIGTRSALFTPLANPGIIVVDEEHDLSFKQQSGLRYNARDLAVIRSQLEKIPLILGSATPSFESLYDGNREHYIHLSLPERVGNASHPTFHMVDIRKQRLKYGLSLITLNAMKDCLANNGQILLFINRRGFAPSLLCHYCGQIFKCSNCDVHLTLHQKPPRLSCHHCGSTISVPETCPECHNNELIPCGIGTERLEIGLKKLFLDTPLVRIDKDTMRKKNVLSKTIEDINDDQYKILLGTQMLTKGHHFPNVTMVVILNADQGMFSADFRASEYLAQLIIQVAGRAGRADKPGKVYIQTHHPDHPLLLHLTQHGYSNFAKASLEERRLAELPPFTQLALIRAENKNRDLAHNLLEVIRDFGKSLNIESIKILGPIAPVIERRNNNYHAQLLLQSSNRSSLHTLLDEIVKYADNLPLAKRVKWSLDVDPTEVA